MKKSEFLNNIKLNKTELDESASVASVLGDPGSPTYGGFIGPLSRISKRKLNSRLFHTWGDASVKNAAGTGSIVEPPQGYVKEHVYSVEGKMVTEGDLMDWFGGDLKQKPAFDGGHLVTIEPKCLAFPYCSQGAPDKPIKLIGETKEHMCESCYGYCSHIAEETGKSPEYIAKLIREKYLSENISLESVYEPAKPIAEVKPVIHQLDESIELKKEIIKNNIENTNTMENIKMTPEMASKCMEGIMENNELAGCMYETLVYEGFLPETLDEGDTYEGQCKTMMEDAEICMEMMKACGMNESDCAKKVNEGIKSFFYGDPMAEFKTFLRRMGKDESMADAIANENDIEAKRAMFMSAINSDESKFVQNVGNRAKDIKHALGLIDKEQRDANRSAGSLMRGLSSNEGVEMEEGAGINPAIYDQLKHCIENGHSYEESKKHVADTVDGWDLSMEDYNEAKKEFGKANEGMELEEGGDDSSRYMFFSNLEQIKRQADLIMKFDHGKIEAILNSGHDWAADHMAVTKENLDQVFDFLMNEIEGKESTDIVPAPAIGGMGLEGPEGAMGPADEIMEYNDEADVEDDVEVKSDSQQYEKELKLVNQFMNDIERGLGKVAAAMSSDEIKAAFNQYFTSFESSRDADADGFVSFLTKGSEESALEYYDRLFSKGPNQSILMLLTSPTKREFLNKTNLMMDDNIVDALDLVDEMQPKIARKIEFIRGYEERKDKKVNKDFDKDDDFADEKEPSMRDLKNIEKMGKLDVDDDDDFLEESALPDFNPKKGKNVDSDNKKSSEKENKEAMKDAEETQETTEEKVDNLKNQKHMNSDQEEKIDSMQHGRNNMLDLDYDNGTNEDFKNRVKDEADGLAPKDHANVDHESEGGKKLMKGVKDRRDVRSMDYGAKGLNIDKEFAYERTDALKEAVESELDKMKKMFTYDQNIINEEKKVKQINENDVFWTAISKKKML
jgi:hypothetical protein